jgi:transposase
MMAEYGLRIRKRIVELYEQKFSTQQIAELLGACKAGVRRVRQHFRERGTVVPLPKNRGRKPKLTGEIEAQIRSHIAAHPDATREELKTALGLSVSLQTISKWLKKLKLPLKKSRCTLPSRTGPTWQLAAPSGTRS